MTKKDSKHQVLVGFTPGADIIQSDICRVQIDSLGEIVYHQVKNTRSVRQMHMSVLVPRTEALKPVILYFPGGGFTHAEYHKFIEMRMALADAGFVVAAVEYRTIPEVFPAPLEDAKSAVIYLRNHAAEYGIDPRRIGVLGDSAGGWIAQLLGTTGGNNHLNAIVSKGECADVQAVVSLYGISDLMTIGKGFAADVQQVHRSPAATEALLVNGPAFRSFPGASISESLEQAQEASPISHIRGNEPPFLIMHGSHDSLVSPQQSAMLYQALIAAGCQANYLLVEGAEHGDLHWYQPEIIQRVTQWFLNILGEPTPAKNATHNGENDNL